MSADFFDRINFDADFSFRSDGTGRTVVAYAAVFDAPAEIRDQDGHYMETIHRNAFDRTIRERAGKIIVLYNHGRSITGAGAPEFSIPIGTPEEIRPDGKGLLTVTRYNRTTVADEVLTAIKDGSISSQSFSGKFIRSDRRRGSDPTLDSIVRHEVMLREYGPTPIPAYHDAAIVGVRGDESVDLDWRVSSRARRLEYLRLQGR